MLKRPEPMPVDRFMQQGYVNLLLGRKPVPNDQQLTVFALVDDDRDDRLWAGHGLRW
jgi:hypothetical protein